MSAFFCAIIISFSGHAYSQTLIGANFAPGSGENAAHQNALSDEVDFLRLYTINDGKLSDVVYRKDDLRSLSKIAVNGYVCGIVVLCAQYMDVNADGENLSRIRCNPDGTFSLKYFGILRPEDLELGDDNHSYYSKVSSHSGNLQEEFLPGGFSLFPKISGNTISTEGEFSLNFLSQGKTYSLPIVQSPLCTFQTISLVPSLQASDVAFRYAGNQLTSLKSHIHDFDLRLKAIADGIGYVESTFDIDLVKGVTIIDFDEIYNAVSCDQDSDIWFYIRTFKEEPIDELTTIAAHETLHVFVNKMHLTEDPNIREFFANLKGYDDFSYEKFILLVTGNSITDEDESTNNVFFSFINEKNYLENRKGGHSQKNLEEFCASFLHSLIFVDRLGHNLDHPLKVIGSPTGIRFLSPAEKRVVLDQYIQGIQIMLGAITSNGVLMTSGSADAFLSVTLQRALLVRRQRWRTT